MHSMQRIRKIYKKTIFFNKDFYEMLSNVKTYQLETATQRFPSQNFPLCCTQFVYLQKDHFRF